MDRTFVATLVVASSLASVAVAQSRTWTDASSKHHVDAELVGVQLRTANGNIITVPLDRLHDLDRTLLLKATDDLLGEAKEVEFIVSAWPSRFGSRDQNGLQTIDICLTTQGTLAAQSSGHAELKLHTVTDEDGNAIEVRCIDAAGAEFQDLFRKFEVDKDGRVVPDEPLSIPVQLQSLRPMQKIGRLAGEVKLRTGGRFNEVRIPNVGENYGRTFSEPGLKIKLRHEKLQGEDRRGPVRVTGVEDSEEPEYIESLTVCVYGEADQVLEVELLDANGVPLEGAASMACVGKSSSCYATSFQYAVPADSQVRLLRHENPEQRTIAFDLRDIAIKPADPFSAPGAMLSPYEFECLSEADVNKPSGQGAPILPPASRLMHPGPAPGFPIVP